jgi:very-short-patch-repair endonuclease
LRKSCLPCVKGGGIFKENDGGIVIERKHNKSIVPTARTLRKNMTTEERKLWYEFLREYPVKFSRQKVLGRYIVDFYCAKAKLVIELDGLQHYEDKNIEEDTVRTEYLSGFGLSVIRIPNIEIKNNFQGVCEYIIDAVEQSLSQQS